MDSAKLDKVKKAPRLVKSGEDTLSAKSRRKGLAGVLETFLRSFRDLSFAVLLIPLTCTILAVLSFSLAPAVFVFSKMNALSADWPEALRYLFLGFALAISYLTYGISILFLSPLANFLIPLKVKEWRGIWYSLPAISWFFHNALTYIVRYTFLELITPSPLNILFYRMMGMKIGKGVIINTTNISDPCLIEIGDYVTIGGSAHLLAHYGQKGFLVLSKVKIGRGTTIGLKASVMGGAKIGDGCMIKPHSVVLPKATVADGDTV